MISDIVTIAVLSLVVIYQDFRGTKSNYGAVYNGIGSIPAVLAGESLAPMQYRVLVPWICKLFGPGDRDMKYLKPYMWIRWVAIIFAISMAYLFFGGSLLALSLLSLFFVVAALYDYTDIYLEVGFFALVFWLLPLGPLWALALITFVAVLNRETALFIPLTALLYGDFQVFASSLLAGIVAYYLPRFVYGGVDRYCDFNMLKENMKEIVSHYTMRPFAYVEYTWFFIILGLFIWAYMTALTVPMMAMGIMFILLLVPTKWREVRVFAPCVLAVIGGIF